nr:hypothetical protein [Tanacetum cinerariifolium]
MVDFIEASPLRYALTVKPTVYVSHIRQFWSTAKIETMEEGTQILATVDGIHRTITESSLRRNLKLQDEEGISSLPDIELFENLTLMGYNISPNQKFTSKGSVFSSVEMSLHLLCEISVKGRLDQDRATIAKPSTLPHDSAPRVTSPVVNEGSMQQIILELTVLCTSLKRQLSELTAKFQAQEERSMDEGEAATERISDDSEEMVIVLTLTDVATVLASGVVDVPTGSGSIPTASTPFEEQVPIGSDVIPTASLVFATTTMVTPYRRRKGKELEEQLEREDQRRSEQIARDAEIARIHAEEELQIMIDGLDRNNETVTKYLQEYHQFALELLIERRIEMITDLVKYQDNYAKIYKYQKVEAKFNSVWKKMEDFIPMGLKEEAERIKRKSLSLEQENTKEQESSEDVPEEVMSPEEVPEEKVNEMMQLVPIEEVYVEALQVKYPIIDRKVYTEGQRSYWKITRLGGSSASYLFFIDLLKRVDRENLNQLWRLVMETHSNRPPTSDKEVELWVELSRLYEPDNKDQLCTHTQNFMHAPVEWKLYDTCGVHHVTSKDKEIFMLLDKDYPLRKGLALAAILKTFGGNEATKKMKKNLLKQQYGNFKAEGSETLEQTFNRHQVIVEVQKKSKPNSQNMAFISSAKHSSGNEDGNTACVPTASTNVPTVSASVATISQDTACAYIASQASGSQIKFEDINQIDEDDIEEMDIKWNIALLSMRADKFWKKTELLETKTEEGETTTDMGYKAKERAPKALMAIDGVRWDWSYMANDEEDHALVADEVAPTEFALIANTNAKSKRSDKNKDGLGYSVVPPPPAQLYLSPKKDLSWTGLSEYADDTVKEYQEKDKIESKLDKNRKRGEAGKSRKQTQWREQEKQKKM